MNFINRLKYAEHKIFCFCLDVYKKIEGNDYDKTYEVLSTLKNEKLKIHKILIEKYKCRLQNLISNKTIIQEEPLVYIKLDMIGLIMKI